MPELAEVELARRQWGPHQGEKITAVEGHSHTRLYRDQPFETLQVLTNRTLQDSKTHGKRMLFSFGEQLHLEVHLGMTGKLYAAPLNHEQHKHDHFLLRTDASSLAFSDYRQFGKLTLHEDISDPWKDLPPEVLSAAFSTSYVAEKLNRFSKRPLKAFILDQRICPGVGNWMADEICWRMGRHPAARTDTLDPAQVRKEVQWVSKGAIRHVADKNTHPSIEGFTPGTYVKQVPPKTWLFQHRWKPGGHCPKCQTELSRAQIATRTTAWCPICQPR